MINLFHEHEIFWLFSPIEKVNKGESPDLLNRKDPPLMTGLALEAVSMPQHEPYPLL